MIINFNLKEMIKKQIQEIEQENLIYIEQETKDNISDLITRRSLKEKGFKLE